MPFRKTRRNVQYTERQYAARRNGRRIQQIRIPLDVVNSFTEYARQRRCTRTRMYLIALETYRWLRDGGAQLPEVLGEEVRPGRKPRREADAVTVRRKAEPEEEIAR
jgi:hypothetical protein